MPVTPEPWRGGITMSIVLDLQGLEVPAEEAAVPGSTISNNC
ncbi:class III lanthipeptide [Streptomyces albus]|nr:class III lanthipeptide [Streptomyces albus]